MATIKLTVSTNFEEASKDFNKFADTSVAAQKKVNKLIGDVSGDKFKEFTASVKRAQAAITATRGKTAGLETAQFRLRTQIEKMINAGVNPLDASLVRLQKEYKRVNTQIYANTKAAELNEKAVKAAATSLKYMAVAAAAVGTVSTKMAMDYTKSMANVTTMTDATMEEMNKLDDQLTTVSNTFAIQKEELSGGIYQALSAGADGLSEALDIVTASATLGKGALIDNTSAVDIVTTAMNAYGKETVSATDAIDNYFNIIKMGKINGEQLSATIGQSITLFASAKVPVRDLGAGIATLTKVGTKASEATTQLNAIVNSFIKPSAAMTAKLNEMGYASGSALLETDGLTGALEFLQTATGGNLEAMGELIPSIRGMRGAVSLLSQDMETYNDVAESFNDVSGVADEALRRQTDGFAKDAFTVEQSIIAIQNLGIALGQKLLPVLGEAAANLFALTSDADKMAKASNVLVPALAGLTAGLVAFVIGSKVAEVGVAALTKSFLSLTKAMLTNPATWVALGIAVAVAAIVLLIKNWDKVVVIWQETLARTRARFEQVASAIKTSWIRAFNSVKIAVLELAGIILDKLMGVVNRFLDLAGRLPFIGEKFQNLQENVNGFANELNAAREDAIANSEAVIQAAKDEQSAAKDKANMVIAQAKRESDARLTALREQEEANEKLSLTPPTVTTSGSVDPDAGTVDPTALSERLKVLNNLEAQAQQERLATFGDFLDARMEQEGVSGEARITFLQNELTRIQELETISNAEREAAAAAVEEKITAIQDEESKKRAEIKKREIQATADLFSSLSDLVEAYGDDNEAAVVASKALASTSAAINSYLAFTQTLADSTIPSTFARIAMAGTVLASGLAQQKNIWSAETGGSFTVPSSNSSRVDSQTMAVNPGEEIDVTPRGEESSKSLTVNVQVEKQTLWSWMQEGLDSNNVTVSNDNLRAG